MTAGQDAAHAARSSRRHHPAFRLFHRSQVGHGVAHRFFFEVTKRDG